MDSKLPQTAIEHVSRDLDLAKNEGDQQKALERLQAEIRTDLTKLNADEQKQYMEQVIKGLTDRGHLPVLSVAFAGQLEGDLSQADLKGELRSAGRRQREGDSRALLEKAMIQYLVDNYDKGAKLVEAKDEEWGTDSKISKADISAKLTGFREQRDEQHRIDANKVTAAGFAAGLLGGGDKSLFNFIDRNSNDGRLTKAELEQYVRDAQMSGARDGHYAPEKVAMVQKLITEWDAKNGGKWMRGGVNDSTMPDTALTKNGLIAAAGKRSEAELLGKPQAEPRPAPEVKPPAPRKPAPEVKPRQGTEKEVEVRKGDSYWSIASRILGEEATAAQILARTKQLQEKNGNKPLIFNERTPMRIKI